MYTAYGQCGLPCYTSRSPGSDGQSTGIGARMEPSSSTEDSKDFDARTESSSSIDHTPVDTDARMESSSRCGHTALEADARMESSPRFGHTAKEADARMASPSRIDDSPKEADAKMTSSSSLNRTPKDADVKMEPSSSVDHTAKDTDIDDEVMWADLPTVLLENIYSMLTMRQRFNCSLVCSNWNDVLLAPSLWRTLEVSLAILCARISHNLFRLSKFE